MNEEMTPEVVNAGGEVTQLDRIEGKIDEIRAMFIEVLEWKTEIESAMASMQGSGMFAIFSKLIGK